MSHPWSEIAFPWQRMPEGEWNVWLMMGGRGSGLTRAGAEAIHALATSSSGLQIGLYGPTVDYVRDVMVEGPTGLRSIPGGPTWFDSGRKYVLWPNGSMGYVLSCRREGRGCQFSYSWASDLHLWDRLQDLWSQVNYATRSRIIATSQPRPVSVFRAIVANPRAVVTRGSTMENWWNLTPQARDVLAPLLGTAAGLQELHGLLDPGENS